MKIVKNNLAGSATLTTMLILFGILAVGLIGINIMLTGLRSYWAQGASTIAYYAAETGVERTLMLYKQDHNFFHSKCEDSDYINFGTDTDMESFDTNIDEAGCSINTLAYSFNENNGDIDYKADSPQYQVKVVDFYKYTLDSNDLCQVTKDSNGRGVKINSQGSYLGTNRSIEVDFCVPDCQGEQDYGYPDGCCGICL